MCYEKGVLQAYLDGELTEPAMERVREHAAECGRCNAILQELRENAAFVDMSVGAYMETISPGPDTRDAWDRFAAKKARRRRQRVIAFAGNRGFRWAAVAASLIFIFLVGTTMLDLWEDRFRPRVSSLATGERLSITGDKAKSDGAGGAKDGGNLERDYLRGAGESLLETMESGSAKTAEEVPSPARRVLADNEGDVPRDPLSKSAVAEKAPPGYGQGEEVLMQTFAADAPTHIPVALTLVKEVYLTVPGKPPHAVEAGEKIRVLAWYNDGVPVGSGQSASSDQATSGGAGLTILLLDAAEITVFPVNDIMVGVKRPDAAYELRAPELAKYLKGKGSDTGADTEN
jgi:hypothetical protein